MHIYRLVFSGYTIPKRDIEKPFSPSVSMARVKANLAQYERISGTKKAPLEITLGMIQLNMGTHRVFVGEQEISLKNKDLEKIFKGNF